MRASGMGLVLVLFAMVAFGCQSPMHDENVQLHRQNRELQEKLNDAEGRARTGQETQAQVASMQQELAARDAKIAELQQQLQKPTPGATGQTGLEGIEVTRDDRAGTMTINLPGDILFTPGSADLKQSSQATLNKIAAALKKDYAGKHIFVDGHTDSDPITRTKGKWEDNLDLSAARARSVEKYILTQGIDSKHVDTRAFGSTKPKASKDKSRRVEIVVATR